MTTTAVAPDADTERRTRSPRRTRLQRAVRAALPLYLASRVVVLIGTWIASQYPGRSFADVLTTWDGRYYVAIATDGYPRALQFDPTYAPLQAFFPGYPLVVRALSPFGHPVISGVLISLAAGSVASLLLWLLAERFSNAATATATVALFVFFPGSFVFGWTYSEGLMLALGAAALLCLARRQLLAAAGFAALATAVRPNALALVVAVGLAAWAQAKGRPVAVRVTRSAGYALVSASGFLAFQAYLWIHSGSLLTWWRAEHDYWRQNGLPGYELYKVGIRPLFDRPGFIHVATFVFLLIAIALLVVTLAARLPAWMKAYTVVVMYFALTNATVPASPRLQLIALPAFIALAMRLSPRMLIPTVAISAALLTILTVAYGAGYQLPFLIGAP